MFESLSLARVDFSGPHLNPIGWLFRSAEAEVLATTPRNDSLALAQPMGSGDFESVSLGAH